MKKLLFIKVLIFIVYFSSKVYGLDCPATPTPTGTVGLTVDPLPTATCDVNQTVTGYTIPYANVYVRVTDMISCEYSDYYQWTVDGNINIPITLFSETINEIAVTACNDYVPIECETKSSENSQGLTVDTRGCIQVPNLSLLGL